MVDYATQADAGATQAVNGGGRVPPLRSDNEKFGVEMVTVELPQIPKLLALAIFEPPSNVEPHLYIYFGQEVGWVTFVGAKHLREYENFFSPVQKEIKGQCEVRGLLLNADKFHLLLG